VLAASGTASAQPPEQPASAAADPRSDAAWQLYHDAFAALMRGEASRARELASALLRDYPDHAAAQLVRSAHLGLAPGAVDEPAPAEPRDPPSSGARAELALFQSLNGLALGTELCIALDCNSGQAYFGAALAGAAVGAIASVSLHDLTSGQRALLNSGTVWGAVNAGVLLIATNNDHEASTISGGLILGQLGGLGLGAAMFPLHPTAGQVALANSGGAWVSVLTELIVATSGSHLDNHEHAYLALIAIDAGIAGGAYLASRWPVVSRAQALVIDAGGIVGTVGGAGIGILILGRESSRATPGFAAAGGLVGLGAAAYLTRDWHRDAGSVHAYAAPPTHGRGAVAGIGFAW
jgi:hypothetical protein